MNFDDLRGASVSFPSVTPDNQEEAGPPVFELILGSGRRIIYLPTMRTSCLLKRSNRMQAARISQNRSQIAAMSDEVWQPPSVAYATVLDTVHTALWQTRVFEFAYTLDFFVGYYLGLRIWQTLMLQLEYRMKVISDDNLFWLAEVVKPQFDSGRIDIPNAPQVSSFGSFMISMPSAPHLYALELQVGSSYGQWRSFMQLIVLLADRGFRFLTMEFIIDYIFECRHELLEMAADKGLDFRTIAKLGDSVMREAGRI